MKHVCGTIILAITIAGSAVHAEASLTLEAIQQTTLKLLGLAHQGYSKFKETVPDSPAKDCSDFSEGETRKLQSVRSQYLITKIADKTYLASLKIDYTAFDVTETQVQEVRDQVTRCYKNAGFLTDKLGQKLKFQLLDQNSIQARQLKTTTVRVHQRMGREDNGNYSLSMTCSTILHETLHLLGLLDEYKEPFSDMRCRAIGNSIMANHKQVDLPELADAERRESSRRPEPQAYFPPHNAYYKARENQKFYPVLGVYCRHHHDKRGPFLSYESADQGKGFQLMAFLVGEGIIYDRLPYLYVPDSDSFQKHQGAVMPKDWVQDFAQLDPEIWSCAANKSESGQLVKTGREVLEMWTSSSTNDDQLRERMNLPLRPAHFRKFLNPTCQEKNVVYDTCTSEAYLTPPAGYQCITEKNPICRSPNWLD